ncbi:DNA-binding transcriptional ArsR family regulator [Methylopila capsulata]|uniref:DNA-binding transcriptional ArsR family regulator n=1 Tax=Methylopila capsulata TaxID=61654 RepID=A0A9W6IUN5_9HYPH|nr:metalloregulator ArsR/SmtB family transcription factor [Methylopila capsulata]MBM7852674.1 DNA-binding transcriptional ArsR family regulator [Methylopila capsulata]GLK56882.1 transcriptional regulator [Methylopila capsulata]
MPAPASPSARLHEDGALDALFALGQPTRLRVFRHLVTIAPNPLPAGGIADALGCLQNTLSTHLAILSRAGLITGVRDGRSILYAANFDGMRGLVNYLLEDCCGGRPEVCAPVFEQLERSCGCAPAPTAGS